VIGTENVFAAGDSTDFEIKMGGIAAQQADAAAEAIAALAGVAIEPAPFAPVLHGIVLGGERPIYLSARLIDGSWVSSQSSETPTWSPPSKIAAKYLGPFLEARDAVQAASR
jgi:sulfide:quinone oxidoreductase